MKLGPQGHLNTNNIFPYGFYQKGQVYITNLDELEKSRVWNREKFVKSKGPGPWIHSKIGATFPTEEIKEKLLKS